MLAPESALEALMFSRPPGTDPTPPPEVPVPVPMFIRLKFVVVFAKMGVAAMPDAGCAH